MYDEDPENVSAPGDFDEFDHEFDEDVDSDGIEPFGLAAARAAEARQAGDVGVEGLD